MTMGTVHKMKASPTGIADEAAAMVEVRGVGKTYPGGVEALRGIDLAFPQGMLTSLLGPAAAARPRCSRSSPACCGRMPAR